MNRAEDGPGLVAATNKNNDDPHNTAEAYHANQVEDYHRLFKMCKFFRRRDNIDYRVREVHDALLEKAPSLK